MSDWENEQLRAERTQLYSDRANLRAALGRVNTQLAQVTAERDEALTRLVATSRRVAELEHLAVEQGCRVAELEADVAKLSVPEIRQALVAELVAEVLR